MSAKNEAKERKKAAAAQEEDYEVGENVMAFHGPLIYEAKIMQVRVDESGHKNYYIHYNGWAKKWDEWVKVDRLMKDTPDNRAYAAELQEKHKHLLQKGKKRKGEGGGERQPKKQRRPEEDTDDETVDNDETELKGQIKLKLTGALKRFLITDWEQITRNEALVKLPRTPSVTKILDDWLQTQKKKDEAAQRVCSDIVKGLRVYFDRALPTVLLYRLERPQYKKIMAETKDKGLTPSDIYGGEHLLRLFVKLPSLLANTTVTAKEAEVLQAKVNDIIKYLDKKAAIFTADYEPVDQEYRKLMQEEI